MTSWDCPKSKGGPEGFCTEAALCFLYIGLYLYMVLTAVALSMVLTGHKRRRYTQRKPMSADPDAPLCECGQYKCEKTKGGFRKKCHRCWLTDFSWLRCEKDPNLMAQNSHISS